MATTQTTVDTLVTPELKVDSAMRKEEMNQLLEVLKSTNTLPLWEQMSRLNPTAPNPTCIPHLWKFDDIKPCLLRAGELVTEKQAERRVLMLINPRRGEWHLYP